ncbi:50S ribosomal protein L25/general stress protein Ctc [Micrococcus endophyticus]|uniref:50S ribosomal protein L25/general stress protein Ctc n=1 Tax=Micrococcus endophyticus TaxID=455343 RepID=UPI0020054DAC|nr:50S ribosomal protein L25/general stress protein Ctc [Micrococcus endophyticus]MCK6091647.1 50S ribosomal protein L25/general stress protein Ctc [Micrococcus endophyticus]
MSDQLKIKVTRRTDFGKGAARQARRAGLIPAVVYGHGQEPVHLLLPAQETTLAVRNPNALLTVVNEAGEEHMVLPKDIQRHALKDTVDHLDLIEVRRGEKVVVDVTVHVEGEVAQGNEYVLDHVTVPVEAEATHLPESVTISVEGREAGEHVYATDVQVPAGTTLQLEDEIVIATVSEVVEQDLGDESVQEEQAAEGDESAEGEAEGGEDAEGESEGSED